MDGDYDTVGGYEIGFTVLAGLWITPLSILWFLSFCLARRKNDPARVGISWMKVVFPIWSLALLFWLVYGALNVWDWFGDSYYSRGYTRAKLYEVMNRISIMGNFFSNLADIFLFITVVEIAGGFLLCLKGAAEPIPMRRFSRIAILAWAVVLFALVIASFGLNHDLASRSNTITLSTYEGIRTTLIRLNGAVSIMFWLTSMPMLFFAAYVVHNTKKHELLRGGAILLLVATVLDFVRLTISMALFIHSSLIDLDKTNRQRTVTPLYVSWIVGPFFDFVLMFILLVILFSLAVKKRKGLWSQPQQQGWAYPTVVYVPAAGVYPQGQVQPGGVMPGQQQQQGLPAYLQVAQQQQQQQQQQPQQQMAQGQQGYYYYPQQQPQQVYQQQGQEQQQTAEPKPVANV
ncbi:hypothetical protein C8A01DRAFT_36964 [Parachaetomium inaequale]|uniref:Uncharacterized protein n=1 Tax=Parachaetomium inaequale TaxID=2588326 RepID=A0AAN6SQ83_9PEZI|nr:hypothetical protein C8A01DRAFT_36964 [Parachaetomium inaequale]